LTDASDSQTTRPAAPLEMRSGRARLIGLSLLGAAAVSSTIALVIFSRDDPAAHAWLLYLGSITLFIVACHVLFPRKIQFPRLSRAVVAWGMLILGLAAWMRLYRLDTLPFGAWYDEANHGLWAMGEFSALGSAFTPAVANPTHFLFLISLSFRLFGASIWAIRLVSAAFGLFAVLVAFFTGREAYGDRFGLLLAFIFAVSRWNVTLSRLGMTPAYAPVFVLLVILFLLRSWRTHHPLDFAWAGLSLGCGLCFYAAFNLFPIVAFCFLVCWGWYWWRTVAPQTRNRLSRLVCNLLVFGVSAWLVAAPVAQFALDNPDEYLDRVNIVSLFKVYDGPDLRRAIWTNTIEHVLMFNYRGDGNGRHNLPGEPMLDPVVGVLFVLGLGLALSHLRNPANFLFLLSFPVGLSAGILSVDFEAPQSLRAVVAMPAVLYFAALAAETLWRGLYRSSLGRSTLPRLYVALSLGVGGVIFYANAHTYFVRQANHDAVWESHNAVETLTARRMLALGPDETTFYVSWYFHNHLVIRFLAPGVQDSREISPPDVLPIRESGDKPVALFVGRENAWVFEQAHHYYPNAQYLVNTNPSGEPVLYTVIIPPDDIREIQGLTARYWSGDTPVGEPVFVRTESTLAADWRKATLLEPPFVVEWSGVLYVPKFGDYELLFQSPAEGQLWLDAGGGRSELPLLALDRAGGKESATVSLAQGNHSLRVQAVGGGGEVRLTWRLPGGEAELATIPSWALYLSPPVSSHGLRGVFFDGPDWQGPPALERVDPFVGMYFHHTPLPRPYSAEWSGQIEAPATGGYDFGLRIHGQAQLFVDDRLVVEVLEPTDYSSGKINLSAGRHSLRLRYLDDMGNSRLYLYWTPPGGERQVISSNVLWPYP